MPFVPPRVPFVDRDGRITRPWFLLLQGLYERTGGTVGATPTDLELGLEPSPLPVSQADAALALGALRHDLEQGPAPAAAQAPELDPDPTVSVLRAEVAQLRAEVARLLQAPTL